MIGKKTKKEENTLPKQKDRSNEFLIGAAACFVIATLAYKLLLSPMLVKMDLYQQAVNLYDNGAYAEAGKTFAKLGGYKDAEEQYRNSNTKYFDQLVQNGDMEAAEKMLKKLQKDVQNNGTDEMQQYKKELEKKAFQLYFGAYDEEDDEDYVEKRYLYRDMDGDGSLECCEVYANGLKYFYTCKDGVVSALTPGECDIYNWASFNIIKIYEQHNLILVQEVNNSGTYYERYYQVNGKELEQVAEKNIVSECFDHEHRDAFAQALKNMEGGQQYKVPQGLGSNNEYYVKNEECAEAEYTAYINKITENERGFSVIPNQLAGWEMETDNNGSRFVSTPAYYGYDSFEDYSYESAYDFVASSIYYIEDADDDYDDEYYDDEYYDDEYYDDEYYDDEYYDDY